MLCRCLFLPAALACLQWVLVIPVNGALAQSADAKGRVGRAVDHCARTVTEKGRFHLTAVQRTTLCSLKVRSPRRTRIKLHFTINPTDTCSNMLLTALDGWQYRKFVQTSSTPTDDQIQETNICPNGPSKDFESSQNVAEIIYWFPAKFEGQVVVDIDFEEQAQVCDHVVDQSSFGREMTISNNGHRGTCRWQLPGAIWFQILDLSLTARDSKTKCGDDQSSYLRLATGDWKNNLNMNICADYGGKGEVLLPCKRVQIELHSSADNATEEVKMRIVPASLLDTLVWDSLC